MASYKPETNDLYITFYTNDKVSGLGTDLLSAAIKASNGAVNTISAELGLINLRVYQDLVSSGMSIEQAALGTPFGKSMQKLGYTNVTVTLNDGRSSIPVTFRK